MNDNMKNILLITADDLFSVVSHREVFGARINTPNLDRLCARGARFDNAYAPIAVCGPSRAATFTGLSPFQTGILDNNMDWKEVLRPEHAWQYRLRGAGYWTSTQGKIFHGYSAQPQAVYNALYDSLPFKITKTPGPNAKVINFGGKFGGRGFVDNEEAFYDHQVADMAIRAIEQHRGNQPFYIEAGFHHPHTPLDNPARFFSEIDLDEIRPPHEWNRGWDMLPFPDLFQSGVAEWRNPKLWDEKQIASWKMTVRNYIASIHYLDYSLGRLMAALEESPWSNNTIVVFFSDHGYHLADRGHWKKFTAYEQAALAPLVIVDPDCSPCVISEPVSLTDIGPTLLDYAGLEVPKQFVGRSLKPQIHGQAVPVRAVPTFWYGSASLRIGDRRFILWQDGSDEAYDVSLDPWQQHPLKDYSERASDRDLLLQITQEWGLKFVEQGVDVSKPTPFTSILGDNKLTEHDVAGGIIGIGSISDRGRIPGYHVMWGHSNSHDETVEVPATVRRYVTASRKASRPRNLRVVGNQQNMFIDASLFSWESFEAVLGGGNDIARVGRAKATLFGGAGDDTLVGGSFPDQLYGGSGNDLIRGGGGNDVIYGGSGNDTLFGDEGNDTIFSGHGDNILIGGSGNNRVVITGGRNVVRTGKGKDHIAIMRTGRLQEIVGFTGQEVIDLSDWVGLGTILLVQSGRNVAATVRRESFLVRDALVESVMKSIKCRNRVRQSTHKTRSTARPMPV